MFIQIPDELPKVVGLTFKIYYMKEFVVRYLKLFAEELFVQDCSFTTNCKSSMLLSSFIYNLGKADTSVCSRSSKETNSRVKSSVVLFVFFLKSQ